MSSLQDIYNKLKMATQSTVHNEVAEAIKKVEHDHVVSDVYNVYDPVMYKRKMDDYGLSDTRDMIAKPYGEIGIEISNDTEHNGTYVADVVETGEGYNYSFDYNGNSRPFQENTVEELQTSKEHIEVLKLGLRSKGIKIE